MAKAIRMSNYRTASFDEEVFMDALHAASTIEILRFLGDVMRVHKVNGLPHTKDKEFMHKARIAYSNRQQQLLKEIKHGTGLRQQHVGDHLEKRPQGKGHTSRLQGVVRDREQGVLDLGLDQGAEGRFRKVS